MTKKQIGSQIAYTLIVFAAGATLALFPIKESALVKLIVLGAAPFAAGMLLYAGMWFNTPGKDKKQN